MKPELRFLPTLRAFGVPVRRVPAGILPCTTFSTEKLEWHGEKFLKIQLLVLTKFTNVTDGRTDRQTDGHRIENREIFYFIIVQPTPEPEIRIICLSM